jgi:hypothetical protein
MTSEEMVDQLVENVLKYGTGFTKLSRNAQGELETTIVPFEDYKYINGEPEWQGLTDEEQSFIYDQVKQIVDSKPFWVRFAGAIEAKLKEKNT